MGNFTQFSCSSRKLPIAILKFRFVSGFVENPKAYIIHGAVYVKTCDSPYRSCGA